MIENVEITNIDDLFSNKNKGVGFESTVDIIPYFNQLIEQNRQIIDLLEQIEKRLEFI